MKAFFLVQLVFLLLSFSADGEGEDFSQPLALCLERKKNTNIKGDNLHSVKGSLSKCCGICSKTKGCQGFAWNNYLGGTCWLKSSIEGTFEDEGFISSKLIISRNHSLPDAVCFEQRMDTEIKGETLIAVPGALNECCGLCQKHEGCLGFSWSDFLWGTCWLKSTIEGELRRQGSMSSKLFRSTERILHSANCSALMKGVELTGEDLISISGSLQECCGHCQTTDGCIGFSWNDFLWGTCVLKSKIEGTVAKEGVNSATIESEEESTDNVDGSQNEKSEGFDDLTSDLSGKSIVKEKGRVESGNKAFEATDSDSSEEIFTKENSKIADLEKQSGDFSQKLNIKKKGDFEQAVPDTEDTTSSASENASDTARDGGKDPVSVSEKTTSMADRLDSTYNNLKSWDHSPKQDCSYSFIGDVYNFRNYWEGCEVLQAEAVIDFSIEENISKSLSVLENVKHIHCKVLRIKVQRIEEVIGIFDNLKTMNCSLEISSPTLKRFKGFNSLEQVIGDIKIIDSEHLCTISAFGNVLEIDGELLLMNNCGVAENGNRIHQASAIQVFQKLQKVNQAITVKGNAGFTQMNSLHELAYVKENILIAQNSQLKTLSLPALKFAESIEISENPNFQLCFATAMYLQSLNTLPHKNEIVFTPLPAAECPETGVCSLDKDVLMPMVLRDFQMGEKGHPDFELSTRKDFNYYCQHESIGSHLFVQTPFYCECSSENSKDCSFTGTEALLGGTYYPVYMKGLAQSMVSSTLSGFRKPFYVLPEGSLDMWKSVFPDFSVHKSSKYHHLFRTSIMGSATFSTWFITVRYLEQLKKPMPSNPALLNRENIANIKLEKSDDHFYFLRHTKPGKRVMDPVYSTMGNEKGEYPSGEKKDLRFETNELGNTMGFTGEAQWYFKGAENVPTWFTVVSNGDLWVFLDQQKIIDLGGVHDTMCRTLKFDSLEGEIHVIPFDCRCILEDESGTYLKHDPAGDRCILNKPNMPNERRLISLKKKKRHRLSIFFAHRIIGESVFGFASNFIPLTSSLLCNSHHQSVICHPGTFLSRGACVSCREIEDSCRRCGPQYFLTQNSKPECFSRCPKGTVPDDRGRCTIVKCPSEHGIKLRTDEGYDISVDFGEYERGLIASTPCPPTFTGVVCRKCDEMGKWAVSLSEHCVKVKCKRENVSPSLANGMPAFSAWQETSALETAIIECDEGYHGVISRQCNVFGQWGEIYNNCQRIYCQPSYFEFTVHNSEKNETIVSDRLSPRVAAGVTIVVSCPFGYHKRSGNENVQNMITVLCQWNGKWGTVVGDCERQFCPEQKSKIWYIGGKEPKTVYDMDDTAYSDWHLWPKTAVGDYQEFFLSCGRVARFCSPITAPKMEWTLRCGSPVPFCNKEMVDRDLLSEGMWPPTEVKKTIELKCPNGNSLSRTCLGHPSNEPTSAYWGPVEGSCKPKSCPEDSKSLIQPTIGRDPSDKRPCSLIELTWPETTAGAMATMKCPVGFTTTRELTRECQPNGQWSNDIAGICSIIYCPREKSGHNVLRSMWWEKTPAGEVSTLICKGAMKGILYRPCSLDGSWGEIAGECIEAGCDPELFNLFDNNGRDLEWQNGILSTEVQLEKASPDTQFPVPCPPGTETSKVAHLKCEFGIGWNTEKISKSSCKKFSKLPMSKVHVLDYEVDSQGTHSQTYVEVEFPEQVLGSLISTSCPNSKDKYISRQYKPNGDVVILSDCTKPQCQAKELNEILKLHQARDILYAQIEKDIPHLGNLDWAKSYYKDIKWINIPVGSSLDIPCAVGPTSFKIGCKKKDGRLFWDIPKIISCHLQCPEDPVEDDSVYIEGTKGDKLHFHWPLTQLGKVASHKCPEGYDSDDKVFRACLWNGKWSNIYGHCDPVQCPEERNSIPISENGKVEDFFWPRTYHKQYAEINCKVFPGYEGKLRRYCKGGKWHKTVEEKCFKLKCPLVKLATDESHMVEVASIWPETFAGDKVTHQCPSGYVGLVERSCSTDGNWGSIHGRCVRHVCEESPAIVSVYQNGEYIKRQIGGKLFHRDFAGATTSVHCSTDKRKSVQAVCRQDEARSTYRWIVTSSCGVTQCLQESVTLSDAVKRYIAPPYSWLQSDVEQASLLKCKFPFKGEIRRLCKKSRMGTGVFESLDLESQIVSTCIAIECPKSTVIGRSQEGKPLTVELRQTLAGTSYRLECPPGYYNSFIKFKCSNNGTWELSYMSINGQPSGFVDMTKCAGR
eukprot:Nk52_evm36s343 gene=Nk52_evmTU36s343